MQYKKVIAAVMMTGFMVFAGCGAKEEAKQSGDRPPVQQEKELDKSPQKEAYAAEIDILKAGANLTDYNGDLLVSPAGDKAVFSGHAPGQVKNSYRGMLVLVDLKTGQVKNLDDSTDDVRALAWAPGGRKVLYRNTDGLFLVNIDNDKKTKISGTAAYGSISQDERLIVYSEPGRGLLTVPLDNVSDKEVAELTKSKEDWYPMWYPDGSIFYFADLGKALGDGAGQEQGPARITPGGQRELLLPQEKGKFRRAEWIVPGEALYVEAGWDDGFFDRIYDLKNKKVIDLGENIFRQNSTAVDVKNGRILYAGAGKVDIYNAEGKIVETYKVDDKVKNDYDYAFSPDGKKVAYISGKLYGDSSTGGEIRVADSGGGNALPLAKGYVTYNTPAWTPDGKAVVVVETTPLKSKNHVFKVKTVPVE